MALLRPLLLGCGLGAVVAIASLPRSAEAAGSDRASRPEASGPQQAAPPQGRRIEAGRGAAGQRGKAAGPTQHGKASYYHRRFNGRRMANGQRFDPNAATAAHKTLPFGTMVRVTNLRNGKSAVVRVTDRGPFVRGRIIDLAPGVAARLEMKEAGVVQVAVTPLAAPDAGPTEIAEAP